MQAFYQGVIVTLIIELIGVFFYIIIIDKLTTFKIGSMSRNAFSCLNSYFSRSQSSEESSQQSSSQPPSSESKSSENQQDSQS